MTSPTLRSWLVAICLISTAVGVVAKFTNEADAASIKKVQVIPVAEDGFANYDFNTQEAARTHDPSKVDWAVSMVFWNNANKTDLKFNYGLTNKLPTSGSKQWGSIADGVVWETESDEGLKTKCPVFGKSYHMRLYAGEGGSMYNRKWGYFVIGTTHRDVRECSGIKVWFGESEESEEWFAGLARDIWGTQNVSEDAKQMHNKRGWGKKGDEPIRVGDHEWHNNGWATAVKIPRAYAHTASHDPAPPPPEQPGSGDDEEEGEEEEEEEPPLIEASIGTTEASEITKSSAKLSSMVNPNGDLTSGYFQWGPTTAYGYTTTVGNLGSGTSEQYLWNTISNLTPGTTYHYRVVATNAAGTVFGNDHSFTDRWGIQGQTPSSAIYREGIDGLFMFYPQTSGALTLEHKDTNLPGQWKLETFSPSPVAVGRTASITRANGDVMTFYRGTDLKLRCTWYSEATGWNTTGPMSHTAVGPPSAIERNNGDVHVFYKSTDGNIWDMWLSGTTWHDQWLGGFPSGNVNAINRPNTDNVHVFYRDKPSGAIYDLWLSGSTWNNQYIGGAPVTDPKPMYRAGSALGAGSGPGFGDLHVFYKATDNALYDVWLSGTTWTNTKLGGTGGGTPAGNVAPIYRTVNGDLHAFYRGTSGYLYDRWMNAQTNVWSEALIGGPIAGTASPVNKTISGELHVFYTRPDGSLYDANISASSWKDELVTTGAAVPSASEESGADSDGDAVLEPDDWCPARAGVTTNHGCPPEGQQSSAGYYYGDLDSVNMFFPQTSGALALKYNDYGLSGTWKLAQFAGSAVTGPVSAIHRTNNDVLAFYRSTDSKIHTTWLNHLNSQWTTTGAMTGTAAGPPSAVERNNGDMHVVYRSTDGTIHDLWYDVDAPSPAWKDESIGGVPVGEPAVTTRADNGDIHVFYRRASGAVYDLNLKGSTWSDLSLAAAAPAAANDPKPLYRPDADHSVSAFYKGTDGKLHDLWLSGTEWHDTTLGGSPAGNAAPIYSTKTGDIHVFYRSTTGYLRDMWINSQTNIWEDKQIGGGGLMKGTPSPVNRTKNGDLHVFYVRSNGNLYDDVFDGTSWVDSSLESGAAVPSD